MALANTLNFCLIPALTTLDLANGVRAPAIDEGSLQISNRWRTLRTRAISFEPAVALALLVLSACGFAFVRLAGEMVEGETWSFDEQLLRAFRRTSDPSIPIGPTWLTKALTDITALGGVTVLSMVTFLSAAYLVLIRKPITAACLIGSVGVGWLISSVVKLGIARPRPDYVPHLVEVHDLSFPSGHAMVSAITYLTLGLLVAPTQSRLASRYYIVAVAVMLTVVIGCSRIFLGVHYPTDVLGGWAAGASWACFCWLLSRRLIPAYEQPSASQPAPNEVG